MILVVICLYIGKVVTELLSRRTLSGRVRKYLYQNVHVSSLINITK